MSESNLAFEADAKDILNALAKVQGLNKSVECLDSERRTFLLGRKASVVVIGTTTDSFAMAEIIGAEVSEQGLVQLDADAFTTMLKKRNMVKVFSNESELIIRAASGSKYEAKLLHLVDDLDVSSKHIRSVLKERSRDEEFEQDVIAAIRDGVKRTEIKSFYSDDIILAHIVVTAKAVRVMCADNFHIASYVKQVKSRRELRLAIPARMFSLVDKFIGEAESVQFSTDGKSLRVSGDGFLVVAPSAQVDEAAFTVVPNYLKSLKDPKYVLELPGAIRNITTNIAAVIGEDNKLHIEARSSQCRFSMKGRSGSVTETVKAKTSGKDYEAMVDPRIFEVLMNKTDDDSVEINFYAGGAGTSGGFKIESDLGERERITLVGTYYTE